MNIDNIKIYAAENNIPISEVTSIIRRHDPLDQEAGVHIPEQGMVSLYVDKKNKVVYKVSSASRLAKYIVDSQASSIAKSANLPVATAIALPQIIKNKVIYATTYIDHDPQASPDAVAVGALISRLHYITNEAQTLPLATSKLKNLVDYILKNVTISDELNKALAERCIPIVEAVTNDMADNTAFVHGDLHLGNILPTQKIPTLIDFEDSGRGSPLWDIATIVHSAQRFGLNSRWAGDCICRWKQVHNFNQALLNKYVDWRRWYGGLSMLKRVSLNSGDQKELDIRTKWMLDSSDRTKWRRC